MNELKRPDKACDVERAVTILHDRKSAGNFINGAAMRSHTGVLDAVDLIYRYDWACVDARLNGREAPGDLDQGVVYERHYALNWLICVDDEWDDISTDT